MNPDESGFRGHLAPASLKVCGLRPETDEHFFGFPGPSCPGLIEGQYLLGGIRSPAEVSGAILPRPH